MFLFCIIRGVAPLRRALVAGALGLMVLASAAGTARAADAGANEPKAVVQRFYDVLLDTMKHADSLGFKGRYAKLDPAISQAFDLEAMTRIAVGPDWAMLSDDLHQQITDRFHRYTVANYASRFDGWSGEKFEVGDVKPVEHPGKEPDQLVETKLIQGNGEPIVLNYLMRKANGRWGLIDIYLTGTISQLASQRSEFSAILRAEGGQGLVKMLDSKITSMSGG